MDCLDIIQQITTAQYSCSAPPSTMKTVIPATGEIARILVKAIEKGSNDWGNLTVSRKGKVWDSNGYRVESFCIRFGKYIIEDNLYNAWAVDTLDDDIHILLVRSDITTPMNRLFSDLGDAKDWKVMCRCADRFSPKRASKRFSIPLIAAQTQAAGYNAEQYLKFTGQLGAGALDTLEGMCPVKLQIVDLCTLSALYRQFSAGIQPEFVHVLRICGADDLDEIRRVFKAFDLTIPPKLAGHDIPVFELTGKNDVERWQGTQQLVLVTYEKPVFAQHIIDIADRTRMSNDYDFTTRFPCPPVIIGSTIWSDRACIEIDARNLRFTDGELKVGRQLIATLVAHESTLMDNFRREWSEFQRSADAFITSYPTAWFQAWHFATAQVLFSGYKTRLHYIQICKESDAARLRLRDDRQTRYAAAIETLRSANADTPWLLMAKPKTKEDTLRLLSQKYAAFRHTVAGEPVMCFTTQSLIRCVGIEPAELDDFVLKLKENQLLEHKTHPVSFAKQEQMRLICVQAPQLTVAAFQN